MDSHQKLKLHPNALLRDQRESQNLTLQDVADKLYKMCVREGRESGISADTVGRWERGVSKPEAHYRAKLCKLFGKSATELGLIEQEKLVVSPQISAVPSSSTSVDGACYTGAYPPESTGSLSQRGGSPAAVQGVPDVLLPSHQAVDVLLDTSDTTSEQQLGALLALHANDLAAFFEEGWSVHELLESLRIVLHGVQTMSKITRRTFGGKLLRLGAAAVLSSIPMPEGRHISEEDRAKLHQALGESIAAGWKLFHTSGNTQVLVVSQAQLYLVQQCHTILPSRTRAGFYTAVYNLLGKTQQFQGRYQDALEAHINAHIASMSTGDPWYVTQSLICQADSHQALGQYAEAIETIEEALRLLGNPSDEDHIRTKAHLIACWADNAMAMEEYRIGQKKLEESAAYLDQISPNEEFDRTSWLQLAGKHALAVGNHEAAIQYYMEALNALPSNWLIRQTFILPPLMVAYACMRDRDRSLDMANKAVSVIGALNAPVTNKQFADSVRLGLLGAFPNDTQVHEFIADLEGRFPSLKITDSRQ